MKQIITGFLLCVAFISFSQEEIDKAQLLAMRKANNYVYEGNSLANKEDFISAEMEYRKALSEQATTVAGAYNLGNTYYKSGNFEEALFRLEEATKTATSKEEKHKAFHNIGNILMENKKCKEAVEAYKSALRNNPSDDETRYNLAAAKICAEEQKDQNQDQDNQDDNQDENQDDQDKENQDQDNKDKEGEDNEDKQDQEDKGDEDKKEGEDEKDEEGKPKDEKEDQGKGDKDEEKEQQQPQPQQGQLSPQQIKSLLEAMNNQEQEVQEKINAEKQKGVKVKTDKDW